MRLMMGLSLGFLVVSSTVGIVLGLISSLLGLVVGILCEHDLVLCASLFISKKG